MSELTSISKFLSYILRHKPEAIGISLDTEGWADVQDIIEKAKTNGHSLSIELIREVVAKNDKKRFALSTDGTHIRAVQGHSTASVELKLEERTPPDILYHGTAERFLEGIRLDGLKPQSRHYVHLSADTETAVKVGQRYGKPVVLKINAKLMHDNGLKFYRAENGVWLTRAVPVEFILNSI